MRDRRRRAPYGREPTTDATGSIDAQARDLSPADGGPGRAGGETIAAHGQGTEVTHSDDPGSSGAARDRLDAAGAAIVEGVERCAPEWVVASVTRIVDAWGRLDAPARADAIAAARAAAVPATQRVVAQLRDLFGRDAAEQRTTPLQLVRSLVATPTAVLRDAGVPAVERDSFEERAFPEDTYDLSPRTLADLGDPDLGPLLLAWGLAKAAVLRERRAAEEP